LTYANYMTAMQHDDGSLGTPDLVAAYEQGISDLKNAVVGMTLDQLQARPIPGKWSTLEVVCHLADTEIYYTDRIERTIALERPLLIGVDERPYADRLNYQSLDLDEQLALFTALRRHVARIVKLQPPEAWQRTAVHSETGVVTLRQLVFQAVRHVQHHLPFIAEKRAAMSGKTEAECASIAARPSSGGEPTPNNLCLSSDGDHSILGNDRMSNDTTLESTTAVPPGPRIVRTVTPVFECRIEGADHFTHSGQHKGVDFTIELRSFNFAEITKYADAAVQQRLRTQPGFHYSDHFFAQVSYVLLADVTHPPGSVPAQQKNTKESLHIHVAALQALRLHSSAGLPHNDQFQFSDGHGMLIMEPQSRQRRTSLLATPSIFRSTDFAACRTTIDTLRNKVWGTTTLDSVLSLATEYHRLSFTLERVEHAFLILMVAFEAMFKRDHKENACKAAQRIGRLLGATTKNDCMAIQKEFNDDPDSFSKVRNQIAHGDPNLNLTSVTSKYPRLYFHVTQAIVKLLSLPSGTIDDTKDYYDEINSLAENRFHSLSKT